MRVLEGKSENDQIASRVEQPEIVVIPRIVEEALQVCLVLLLSCPYALERTCNDGASVRNHKSWLHEDWFGS